MDRLRCIVERITYQNDQNGYSVIKCKAKGYNDLVTVVGAMPEVHVGAVLTLTGKWKIDAKYGRQFSIETFEETLHQSVRPVVYRLPLLHGLQAKGRRALQMLLEG